MIIYDNQLIDITDKTDSASGKIYPGKFTKDLVI